MNRPCKSSVCRHLRLNSVGDQRFLVSYGGYGNHARTATIVVVTKLTRYNSVPFLSPAPTKDVPHTRIHVPKGGVADKDKTLTRLLQLAQNVFQVRRRIKVALRILGDQTVKVPRQVSRRDRIQHVRDNVLRAIRNVAVLEELDGIGNQAALGHGKEVVERLESLLAIGGRQCALAAVLFKDATGG